MRRATAALLTVLFGLTLIAPFFASGPERNLPPCCRRDGKHHCARMFAFLHPGNAPQLTGQPCPLYPRNGVTPDRQDWSLAAYIRDLRLLLQQRSSAPQAEAGYRTRFSRHRQERAPPAAVLS